MNEVSGRMTDSWSPSSLVRREAIVKFPHCHVDTVIYQFRDYYQDPSHNVVLQRSAWDRKFLAWCSRREEAWLAARQDHEEKKERGVVFDDVTGLPRNPRPITYQEGS